MTNAVVAIGVFDGLHFGHQALIAKAQERAAELAARSVALTFYPHPMQVVRGMQIQLLVSEVRRKNLLQTAGIDYVHMCDFNPERAAQLPHEFIQEVLIDNLHAVEVVVGKGFRFGKGASGTIEDFAAAGLVVHEVDQVLLEHSRVSSTRIREAVANGEVELAHQLLTRPHRYQGIVVGGLKRGRELGYPTANLQPQFPQVAPADGVYAGFLTELDSAENVLNRWPAAISVGTNPTFDDVPERVVEAYALDETDLDLYGKTVAVDFIERIRPMLAFKSIQELIDEMAQDVRKTRIILGSVS